MKGTAPNLVGSSLKNHKCMHLAQTGSAFPVIHREKKTFVRAATPAANQTAITQSPFVSNINALKTKRSVSLLSRAREPSRNAIGASDEREVRERERESTVLAQCRHSVVKYSRHSAGPLEFKLTQPLLSDEPSPLLSPAAPHSHSSDDSPDSN